MYINSLLMKLNIINFFKTIYGGLDLKRIFSLFIYLVMVLIGLGHFALSVLAWSK